MIKNFINEFENQITKFKQDGFLSRTHFTEKTLPLQEGHSRILSILTMIIFSIGYMPDIQRKMRVTPPFQGETRKVNDRQPDITIIGKDNTPIGVVEYESPDASEEKVLGKVENFIRIANANSNLLHFFLFYSEIVDSYKGVKGSWIRKKKGREKIIRELLDDGMIAASKKHTKCNFILGIICNEGIEIKQLRDGKCVYAHKIKI